MSALRGKKSPHCGRFEEMPAHLMAGFHLQVFSHLSKSTLADINSQYPLFPLPKIGANLLQTGLVLQTTPPALQSGTQGQTGRKKGEPFNDSPCHVIFCSVHSYTLLMKTTPNPIVFSKSFALWQNTFSLSNSLSKIKFVL